MNNPADLPKNVWEVDDIPVIKDYPIQWLLLRGTQPALRQEDFGPSKSLFGAVNSRFSLRDQFRGGEVQKRFDAFARAVRGQRIEATSVELRGSQNYNPLYVVAPKHHRSEVAEQVLGIAKANKAVTRLMTSPNLMAAWNNAQKLNERIVGGVSMDPEKNFMFFLARPALEQAKSLFGIPESSGRYRPRPERDPFFYSFGNLAATVVEYPEQLSKAFQHSQYFMMASAAKPRVFAFVSQRAEQSEGAGEVISAMKEKGIEVWYQRDHPDYDFFKVAKEIARDWVFLKKEPR